MMYRSLLLLMTLVFCCSCRQSEQTQRELAVVQMLIRISEIEIVPEHLDDYLDILKEEASASVRLEPGVIAIYPMFIESKPNHIRILEIYADKAAYEAHLQTPHFRHYKTNTLHMVKALQLVDMKAIDYKTMPDIFKKLE